MEALAAAQEALRREEQIVVMNGYNRKTMKIVR